MAKQHRCNWAYDQWNDYLGTKDDRPIPKQFGSPRSTRVIRLVSFDIAIRYHSTNVVVFHRDGTTSTSTGGWYTNTTRARINTFAPIKIYQEKGVWYYGAGIPYESGMRFNADGTLYKDAPELPAVMSHDQIQAAPYYVLCEDTKWFTEKTSTLILPCETLELARTVAENARRRAQRHVRIFIGHLPPLTTETHVYSQFNRVQFPTWYEKSL